MPSILIDASLKNKYVGKYAYEKMLYIMSSGKYRIKQCTITIHLLE